LYRQSRKTADTDIYQRVYRYNVKTADTDISYNESLFRRVEGKKHLLDSRRPLPKAALTCLREELRVLQTYNSNAIEGNTLTLQETELIITDGITIGGKSLREHLEAVGNAEAFDLVGSLATGKQRIDHQMIQHIHALVTRGQQSDPGQYRTHNVRIVGAAKRPPDFSKIVSMMDDLVRTIARDRTHPLIKGAYIHHRFVDIHPFSDGNGRMGRLLLNLHLIRSGYPPVVLKIANRKRYYACLRKADGGQLGPLVDLVVKAVDGSLSMYLSVFGGDDELVPLKELARESPYSQEYLSLRARQDVLDAVKLGNVWHSSRSALDNYVKEFGRE